jgi:hypothetical protein
LPAQHHREQHLQFVGGDAQSESAQAHRGTEGVGSQRVGSKDAHRMDEAMTRLEVFEALLVEYSADEASLDLEYGAGSSGEALRLAEIENWRKRYAEASE